MEYQDYGERHLNKKKSDSQKKERKKKKTGQIATNRRFANLKERIREVLRFLLCLCHDHKITVKE